MSEQPLTEIEQHHLDTVTERIGLNRLKVEQEAAEQDVTEEDQEPTGATTRTAPDPADVREAVTRQAVLGALLDEVKKAYQDARRDTHDLLEKQHKATGTTKTDAVLPSGIKVGSITRQGGERAAQVTDEDALTAWVRDTFPTEHVVTIVPARVETSVRPAFLTKLLAEVTATDAPQFVDPASAVIHTVPGVEIRPSRAAAHRITYGRGSKANPATGRELVHQAWREGLLAQHVLPVLAPSYQPAAIQTCSTCGTGYNHGQPCPGCEFTARIKAAQDTPAA
ncbi:hypothetical protein ACH4JZ_18490 [Streptomyces sp. NPDC017615]|uniref:hypothetical protein n=1 Tax=Streptomyces sp. NPDC017615 TaxID=3365003 RepID=UPI00378D7305